MTLIYQRNFDGPKTHALVVGVGAYPHAKPGQGVAPLLRDVRDLPSAADSAKLMCDWLISHADKLEAKLASIEVLISDPPGNNNRYNWQGGPVEPATENNLMAAGIRWMGRLQAEGGAVAVFHCCGHGASLRDEPVLFLEDLNHYEHKIWSHLKVRHIAQVLRKTNTVAAAFMFCDACGEQITEFDVSDTQDVRFAAIPPGLASRSQVLLLAAASAGYLAYDGAERAGSDVKFGRFTQTAIKGLEGASARWVKGRWVVHANGLQSDLKSIRHVYFQHWDSRYVFDPYPVVMPSDPYVLVEHQRHRVPVVVTTDPPARITDFDLYITARTDPAAPWLSNRTLREPTAWLTSVPGDTKPLFALATDGVAVHWSEPFIPKNPVFDQTVEII